MSDRTLQIFRDGRRFAVPTKIQLPHGAQGNLITLREMAKIVREDALFPDLKNYVFREIIGFEEKSLWEKINTCYEFSRDRIIYEQEKPGFETVADLWSCLYALNPKNPQGDCAIKIVALATMLSYLKVKSYFVAIKQIPNADYFNHAYLAIVQDGKEITLDPTPPEFRAGDKLNFYQRVNYQIFK